MSCDPAVVEMIGWESETSWPYSRSRPGAARPLYCRNGKVVASPEPLFKASSFTLTVTAVTGSTGAGFQQTISNNGDRPAIIALFLDGHATTADTTPASSHSGLIASFYLSVTEYLYGGTPTQPAYGGDGVPLVPALGASAQSLQTTATGSTVIGHTASIRAQGVLPPLAPGRAYYVRPSYNFPRAGSAAPNFSVSGNLYWAYFMSSMVDPE